jgi:hypothetical protein
MLLSVNMNIILLVVEVVAINAYLLLAYRLIRSGRFLGLPVFTAYSLLMVVDLVWHPQDPTTALWIELPLLALRFCAVIEAVLLVLEDVDEKISRNLLATVVFLALMVSSRVAGYFDSNDLRGVYYGIRLHWLVATGAMCLLLNIYQMLHRNLGWSSLWLPHFRILSAYLMTRAVINFLHVPGTGEEHHRMIRVLALATYTSVLAVWLWYDRRELRATRFQRLNPAL